jgi:pimeloyl-ACP methyl ester carboxylesterase
MKEATMDTSRTHTFTIGRIVALVLIGLMLAGLAFLRFASNDDPVSVPDGAEAGDLELSACDFESENGLLDADCGTLVVAENGTDPESRLIALPVIRIRAGSDDPGEAIFRLNGGPGQSNMDFPQAARYSGNHDVVMVGYRGADGSVRLDCPEVEAALQRSPDFLAEESLLAYGDAFRSCADRLGGEGTDLSSYGLVQQADDIEAARVALGYDRINLLSESAGTRTAMIYAWRYPESIHRSVMFGVNPPGHLVYDPETTDEQIGRYAELCSEDPGCRERTDDMAGSMRRVASDMPDRWLVFPIKPGNVPPVSFMMMMQSTAETGLASASAAFDTWLSAGEGDASGLWFQSVFADLMYPRAFVWGQYAAGARVDAQAARDYFASGGADPVTNLGNATNIFAWGGGALVNNWPAAREEGEYSQVRTSEVEALLIGGDLDASTPPQVATEELLPYLPNGQDVTLEGFVHSSSFWSDQPEAGTRLITTFFDSGQVDDSLYQPQSVDFTPGMTGTSVAKLIAAVLLGLALLMLLSLTWMARRVQTKGGFGAKASSVLRSVFPIVLGLGGLAFGALIVLVTMPKVHLDNPILIILAEGVPIGLGIYWAWVHRDCPLKTKTWGLLAAVGGGLLGAWWGFSATGAPMALITAIAGAIVGANLPLIVGDIVRDRRAARTEHPVQEPGLPSLQRTS